MRNAMRNTVWLIATSVALAATPAAAQNNVTDAANTTAEVTTTDANVAVDANLVAGAPPADNGLEAAAPVAAETANTPVDDDDRGRGFPWGLLGLIGLVGLLGRRRGD
jgi:MYXO-CTERM domain-containing protein